MKTLLYITVLLFAGCAQNLTLFPRGGGEQATGTLNDGSRNMTINLKGETYTGSFTPGQTFGFGIAQTYGATPTFGSAMMVGSSNQSIALLTSGKNVIRCELRIVAAMGGSGICIDKDDVTYDLLVKPK